MFNLRCAQLSYNNWSRLFALCLGFVFYLSFAPIQFAEASSGQGNVESVSSSAAGVVSSASADGPYHVGLQFVDTLIDPAPEAFYPCIEGLPSSCNGFAQFELTTPGNNFVSQGGLAGWSEADARRAVALAVDDVIRDIDTGDPNTRARINIYVGAASPSLGGQRLNVALTQLSDPTYPTALLGSASGQFDDPLKNDEIVAVTYLDNIDKLGDSFVTYDTSEKAINAIAGTAAHEIGHVFGISNHVVTLPGDTEPYPLVSSEADGLPTSARLTERRFSTIRPAGTPNATKMYQNAGITALGDINLDSMVDAADVATMFGNWAQTDRLYNEGDVEGDHMIDAADVGVMFGNWTGDPGPAGMSAAVGAGAAAAEYDPITGEIVVSVNEVLNWYIEQVGGSAMIGPDSASPPLPLAGGLVSDSDVRVGETAFASFSYTDVNLGAVAATGLADDGSLKIFWNAGLESPLQEALVSFAIVPEPTAIALAVLGLGGLLSRRRRRAA